MSKEPAMECSHRKARPARKRPVQGEVLQTIPAKKITKGFFIVANDKGLHTRPSTELVKCATHFKSQVNLICDDVSVNAKSLLGILTLAASRGTRIEIEARGDDALEAVTQIIELARNRFYIHY